MSERNRLRLFGIVWGVVQEVDTVQRESTQEDVVAVQHADVQEGTACQKAADQTEDAAVVPQTKAPSE